MDLTSKVQSDEEAVFAPRQNWSDAAPLHRDLITCSGFQFERTNHPQNGIQLRLQDKTEYVPISHQWVAFP